MYITFHIEEEFFSKEYERPTCFEYYYSVSQLLPCRFSPSFLSLNLTLFQFSLLNQLLRKVIRMTDGQSYNK